MGSYRDHSNSSFLSFSLSPFLPPSLFHSSSLFMWAIQNPGIHVKFQMVSAKQINSSHHTKASRRPDTGLNEKYNINCFMSPSSFNLFSLLWYIQQSFVCVLEKERALWRCWVYWLQTEWCATEKWFAIHWPWGNRNQHGRWGVGWVGESKLQEGLRANAISLNRIKNSWLYDISK